MNVLFDSPDHFEIIINDIEKLLTLLSRANLSAATWVTAINGHDVQGQYVPVKTGDLRQQWRDLCDLDTDRTANLNAERRAWYTHYIVREQDIAATICPGWHYRDKTFTKIRWHLNIGLNYRHAEKPLPALSKELLNTVKDMML